jgi:hypothetical protein
MPTPQTVIGWRWILVLGYTLFSFGRADAARTFYWSMESNIPDQFPAGSDSTMRGGATRVTDQAYSGSYALDCGKSIYDLAMFDNPTSSDIWASPEEGTIRLKFRYAGTPNFMLFQITGKDVYGTDDTNDAIALSYHPAGRWVLTYGYNGGGSTVTIRQQPDSTHADTWTPLEIKWRTSGAPYLSLTVDGRTVTGSTPFGATACNAWHHLLIGNDLSADPEGLWIDDFEVFDTWETSTAVTRPPARHALRPAPGATGRAFSLDGRPVNNARRSGVYLMETDGTVRKTLFINR